MKIGPLILENNLFLAPLLDITSGPYRRFCRKLNKIGLVSIPMLYNKRIDTNPRTIEKDIFKIEEERPVSVQLIGSNLSALKNSLDFLSSYRFDILDINAGCPSKRAIKAKEGGYLLKDLNLLSKILNIAVKYSPQPVSLKMRTGFSNTDNLNEIIQIVKNSNISLLTVHGRAVQDKFDRTTLNLNAVRQIKLALDIPVVGNGDIDNPQFAKEFMEYTKVDAIMIGRGSMGNPEIFKQIESYIYNSELKTFDNNLLKMEFYGKLYEKCIDEYADNNFTLPCTLDDYKFIELKRNMIWFTKQIQNSTNLRIKLAQTKTLFELKEKLFELFN